MITEDDNIELITDDTALVEGQDKLMTSAAQNMMVCLYRNQLLNVFVRVAMVAIPINSCVNDRLSIGKVCFTHVRRISLKETHNS